MNFRPIKRALKAFQMRFQRQPNWLAYMNAGHRELDFGRVGDGTDSSVVMAPLLWACRTFPEAPIMVEEHLSDGTEEEVVGHPLTQLLRRPNPYFSGELMWWATIASVLGLGNAYWIKIRDNQLRVVQLWWVPNFSMSPKWPNDGSEFISHYEYKPGGEPIRIENEDVVHFRYGIDPDNQRLGRSPLASVLREVFSDDEAAIYLASMLKNMGVPGLMVAPDGDAVVSDEDLEATKASLSDQFTGRNRGKPFVAGAPTKVTQFGFSPEQLDLKALRRIPEERVTAVLGIPAIVAGLGAGLDRSTFANMAEAREMAYETTIIPLQRLIGADLSNQIMSDFEPNPDRFQISFDLTQVRVLQEDENKKTDRKLAELKAGAITLAEYRRETNRDAKPEHEVFYLPFSVAVTPESGLGIEASPSSSSPGVQPDLTEPPPDLDEAPKGRTRGWKATQMQRDLMKAFQEHELSLAGSLTAELVSEFLALGSRCASALEDAGTGLSSRSLAAEYTKGAKAPDDSVDRLLADQIAAAAGADEFNKDVLRPALEKHYGVVTEDTVKTINNLTPLNVDLPDEAARRIISQGGTRAGLVDVSRSTRNIIFRSLRESRELGEGVAQAARRIRDQVPAGRFTNAGPQYRSQLIARTETKYAQNISAMEAYKATPEVSGLLAFDAQGAESDADCISRDGETFTFADADVELAREHPGGTLSFAPVI